VSFSLVTRAEPPLPSTVHRFYVPPEKLDARAPVLTGAEAHHCARVRRVTRGEPVVVFDGQGREITAEVDAVKRDAVRLRVLAQRNVPPPAPPLTLAQAFLPHRAMDTVIQKATELGVTHLVPVLTQRTVAHASSAAKAERWREIAIEAAKQCGAAWLPAIEGATPLRDFLKRPVPEELKLIASLQPGARPLRDVLREFTQQRDKPARGTVLLIGPEGDFTEEEYDAARTAGFTPITFGAVTLRSETAALYGLSILSYELRSTASV
jgi:16S rRNA (uracil1498-N3)-methyltransferase